MFCIDADSLGEKKQNETNQKPHHQKKFPFFFFSSQLSLFSSENIHLGHNKVSYKSLLCMVQTSNRNLGPSIFTFRSGSLTQAKIYTLGRRNVSSLKHQTGALQSPAFCYVACSQYTDFCENSWTTQSPRLHHTAWATLCSTNT